MAALNDCSGLKLTCRHWNNARVWYNAAILFEPVELSSNSCMCAAHNSWCTVFLIWQWKPHLWCTRFLLENDDMMMCSCGKYCCVMTSLKTVNWLSVVLSAVKPERFAARTWKQNVKSVESAKTVDHGWKRMDKQVVTVGRAQQHNRNQRGTIQCDRPPKWKTNNARRWLTHF